MRYLSAPLCHGLVSTRKSRVALYNSLGLYKLSYTVRVQLLQQLGLLGAFIQGVLKKSHRAARKMSPCLLLHTWRGSPPGRCQWHFHLLAVARPMYQAKSTITVDINQHHAVVTHQKLSLSLWVLYLWLLSVLHNTFCAHFLAEMTHVMERHVSQ